MRKRKRKIIKLLFSLTNSLKSKDSSFTIINNKENQQTHSRSWNQQSKNIFAVRQFIDYQNNCTLIFFWLTKQFTMAAHQINPDIIIQFGKKKDIFKTATYHPLKTLSLLTSSGLTCYSHLQVYTKTPRRHCWVRLQVQQSTFVSTPSSDAGCDETGLKPSPSRTAFFRLVISYSLGRENHLWKHYIKAVTGGK